MRIRLVPTLAVLAAAAACGRAHHGTPGCVPESDATFCARLSGCETLSAADNCGVTRSASCGGCIDASKACVAGICQAPACSTFTYGAGTTISSVSQTSVQDAITGCTPAGSSLLVQRGTPCGPVFSLFVADSSAPLTYSTAAVPTGSALSTMRASSEGAITLTPDGRTIIGVSTDGLSLLASTRTGPGTSDFGVPSASEFAALSLTTSGQLSSPVLSADGLDLYYTVSATGDPAKDGIYEAVRASTGVAFPAGTRMPAAIQAYGSVTGVSSDRMTLFLTASFQTFVFTRLSVTQPYTNPNGAAPPPTVPGFRTAPMAADCSALIGTCTPGGCGNEDVCRYTRQ